MEKAIEVQIAAKRPDGTVFVENTTTREISMHGASLTTRSGFPLGAPIAIRRAGAQPVRARVVSSRPAGQPGMQQVGVEFVGSEEYWHLEFPRDWADPFHAGSEAAAAQVPEEKLAAADTQLGALDASLEGLVRKAETLRSQAAAILAESAADLETLRRKHTATLNSQVEALTSRIASLEEQMAAKAREAADGLRAQAEAAGAGLSSHAAAQREKIATAGTELDGAIEAGRQKWQRMAAEQEQKAAQAAARMAAQLDEHRKALAAARSEAAALKQQLEAFAGGLKQETERQLQKERAEMRAAAIAVAREFHQQLPALGQEAASFFSSALNEQKASATQWIAQALDGFRASLVDLENGCRSALRQGSQEALEDYKNSLRQKTDQLRETGDSLATALEARLERARNALAELNEAAERALNAARDQLNGVGAQAAAQLREAGASRIAELDRVASHALTQLSERQEAIQANAGEAARHLEQTGQDLRETNAALERSARQRRAELEALFVSLMERYDTRKEALDRLLETLEAGRTALRSDLDCLRTATEENQARLQRFVAERESVLKTRATEMEQKLQAAAVTLEAGLQERAAASLKSLHEAFGAGLERSAAEAGRKFQDGLNHALEAAALKHKEAAAELERVAERLRGSLETAASAHAQRLGEIQQAIAEDAVAARAATARAAADAVESVKQAAVAATAGIEARQTEAASATAEMVAAAREAGAALLREKTESESQVRHRQQAMEARFATLSAALEEKRASAEAFCSRIEQARSDLAQSFAALERRVEEAASSMHVLQREMYASLDRRAAALDEEMRQNLEKSLHACEQSLTAIGDAAQEVLQARMRSLTDQTLTSTKRLVEQTGDSYAANLERSLQKARAEHEQWARELLEQSQEVLREHYRKVQEFPVATLGSLNEQIQNISRLAVERVREAHEMLLREMPSCVAEAETQFRQNLAKIVDQAREETAASLRAVAAQLNTQAELDLRRRAYTALQSGRDNGET